MGYQEEGFASLAAHARRGEIAGLRKSVETSAIGFQIPMLLIIGTPGSPEAQRSLVNTTGWPQEEFETQMICEALYACGCTITEIRAIVAELTRQRSFRRGHGTP